jgi:predicted DNA-binding protein YlxM (UPF0122 family)
MREFSDTDLEKWSKRFQTMGYTASFSNHILIISSIQNGCCVVTEDAGRLLNTKTRHKHKFSVSRRSYNRFKSLLIDAQSDVFRITYVDDMYTAKEIISSTNDEPIEMSEKYIKIKNTDFILFEYETRGTLFNCIKEMVNIEDSCNALNKYFSYDENGIETNNLPHQINDLVVYNADCDQSNEFLITDIKYLVKEPLYIICKIEEKYDDVIVFGSIQTESGEYLVKSRNHKLEKLLD